MSAAVSSPPNTVVSAKQAHYAALAARYTPVQQEAILQLYDVVRCHWSTSGGNTIARLLLGLYNGERFPFDLTDLRLLDNSNFEAAMVVLRMDARHTHCEVHVLLDALIPGLRCGPKFERWAYDLKLKNRCKREYLEEVAP